MAFTQQQRVAAVRRTLNGEKVKDVAKSLGVTGACVSIWRGQMKPRHPVRRKTDYEKVGRLVSQLVRQLGV